MLARLGANAAQEKVTDVGYSLDWIGYFGKILAQQTALRAGRAFIENKYVRATGKAAKYTGIAVGATVGTPLALIATPFVMPALRAKQPAMYETLRAKVANTGTLGSLAMMNVEDVPGKVVSGMQSMGSKMWEGMKNFGMRMWERAGRAKDSFCDWANDKRLKLMESAGMASVNEVKQLKGEISEMRAMLEMLVLQGNKAETGPVVSEVGDAEEDAADTADTLN